MLSICLIIYIAISLDLVAKTLVYRRPPNLGLESKNGETAIPTGMPDGANL